MQKSKRILNWLLPFIIFIGLALLLVAIPLIKKQTFLGSDSLFHYNRFYDAAMQLKTHKISYFQSNYGFLQTGRIMSALYGPVVAYLGGFLLLIAGTWFKFQILTDLIVLVGAALGMYKLCRVNEVSRKAAIFMGFIYMYSSTIVQWTTAQQFTALGAAIIPFVMIYATQMVRKFDVSYIGFAFTMSILIQTHLMSSVIAMVGILPFFIVGLVKSDKDQRIKLILHTIFAALITLALTINVWYNLITLNLWNKLLPVYPVPEVRTYGYNFNSYSLINILKPTEFLLFLVVLYFVIRRFKQIDLLTKTTALTGFGFLIIAWSHFPWGVIQKVIPQLAFTLQFPKRFLVLAFVFLLLTFGRFVNSEFKHVDQKGKLIMVASMCVLIIGSVGLDFYAIHQRSQNYVALNTKHHHNNYNDNSLYYYTKKHHRTIQKDTQSHDLGYLMHDYLKATPDYLPAKKNIVNFKQYNAFDPYLKYYHQYIKTNHLKTIHFKHYVKNDGSLTLKFKATKAQTVQVPLAKYANTQVTINGNIIKNVKTTNLGAIIMHAKKGENKINIKYMTSFTTRLLMVLTWVSWMIFVFAVFYKIRKR